MESINTKENYQEWIDSIKKDLDMAYDLFKLETTARRKREMFLMFFCIIAAFYANPITGTPLNTLIDIKALSLAMEVKDAFFVLPIIIGTLYVFNIVGAKNEASLAGHIRYYQDSLRFFRKNNTIPKIVDIGLSVDSAPTTFMPSSTFTQYISNPFPDRTKISKPEIAIGIIYSLIPFATIILIGLRGKQLNSPTIISTCFVAMFLMIWTISKAGGRSTSTTFKDEKI